ncbi:MAG: sodium:solute symporter [Bacteroidetes bacterium]|nr:MAG: sodium:solute symporter [Bacteroidota bacterium]
MSSTLGAILLFGYFGVLFLISRLTGRNASNTTFFRGNRTAPWWAIAFGMIGTSLSGITMISVPGWVETTGMGYMQMVLGYVVGYYIIAYVLLPVYYRLQLPSIYSYLSDRFGRISYATGASFFILNRTIIASLRLFVVASVLHGLVFSAWGVPFWSSVVISLALIWVYTHRAGIQTIIWTDSFQTLVMFLTVIISLVYVCSALDFGLLDAIAAIRDHANSRMFYLDDWKSPQFFVKQFLTGAFIPVVMTGLDQDMMQKNLACRTLKDAQKNMVTYGYGFIPINLLLLSLGVLLVILAGQLGIAPLPAADKLYPTLATGGYLPSVVGVVFTLGVIAAAYSSADSALTALTTSVTIDILRIPVDQEAKVKRVRLMVHAAMSVAMVVIILLFKALDSGSVIGTLFTSVSYLYGPLLGIYAFGLFTHCKTREWAVPVVAIVSPVVCWLLRGWLLSAYGYSLGYEVLMLNGGLTFGLLWLLKGEGHFEDNRLQRRSTAEAPEAAKGNI